MTTNPGLNLNLLQQISLLTTGLRAGVPADSLLQTIRDQAPPMTEEDTAALNQMARDLKSLQEGKGAGASLPTPLLRELTQAVDHQVRNAHTVATASLQTGEMELDDLQLVLAEMGDTAGLEILENVRARMAKAREGILRASEFLEALSGIAAPIVAGEDPQRVLGERIAQLMNWKPIPAAAPAAVAPSDVSGLKRISVLYVEDEEDLGAMVASFIGTLGFVEAVYRSTSFDGAMLVYSERPDLSVLVTDYHLNSPQSGLDLARELHQKRPDLKRIFVSGSVDELKQEMTPEERADIPLLQKPFDLDALERDLRRLAFGETG